MGRGSKVPEQVPCSLGNSCRAGAALLLLCSQIHVFISFCQHWDFEEELSDFVRGELCCSW